MAATCFAICEWNAVYCAERIHPGDLESILRRKLTAGKIAEALVNLIEEMPESNGRNELQIAAQSFSGLVILRNNILHGKPCSNLHRETRLSAQIVFEIADLEMAADEFSACSIELNRLLHGFLETYIPASGA